MMIYEYIFGQYIMLLLTNKSVVPAGGAEEQGEQTQSHQCC